ncbi:MAG: hypothetical protein RR945_00220 [Erysipelotrichaceae bacterium]
MSLYEIIVSLSLLTIAVSSIVFPTIYLARMRKYHHQANHKDK